MSDVETTSTESSNQEAGDDLVDLSRVRDKYQELIEGGNLEHARMLLDQLSNWPDSTRYLDDNLWLYGKLGDISRALESEDDAMSAYRRGFELDPRSLDILQPYSELLFHHNRNEEGLEVVQALLLHHKRRLPQNELVSIYTRLGTFYEGTGQLEKARTAFEKSLEQVPDDQNALTGLLRVVAEVGEPLDVVRVRQKLIRTMSAPQTRASALVALGDDWAYSFNDPGRALDTYEQALIEDKNSEEALKRIASVGAETGDWRRVSRAYFTLSQLTDDPASQAEWIMKSSIVARDELWESDKALVGFKKALSLDPSRLDAFKAVTSLLVDAKDWDELETAYVEMITANVEVGTEDPRLMGILWSNLGELYKSHLNRLGDAIFAYEQAAALTPSVKKYEQVAALAEDNVEHLDTALTYLRKVWEMDRSRSDCLDRMGRVLLRQKMADKAWCMFRAAAYLSYDLDEKAKGFVDRFDTAMFRKIKTQISPNIYAQYIFSAEMDPDLTAVFRAIKPGLEEWTGESHSKYGLKRKDRVKIEEPLSFNNIYKSVGHTLGYKQLPELWHKSDQHGLVNGALVPEGMIAGDDILGSGREEYTAFVIGKQLFLFLTPFYLPAIRPVSDLQVFLLLGASHARSDLKIEMSKDMESAFKAIKKRVKGAKYEALQKAIYKISDGEADVAGWVETVEDAGNRMGLLFCDDLNAADEYLRSEPHPIGSRTVEQKMDSLVEWSVSQRYLELREQLGITLG